LELLRRTIGVVMTEMLGRDVAERVSSLRPNARVFYIQVRSTCSRQPRGLEQPFTQQRLPTKLREVLNGEVEPWWLGYQQRCFIGAPRSYGPWGPVWESVVQRE
jgi:hypothetical protein